MSQQDRLNDELLVLRCQEGDAEAFELLVERWQRRLWRHAWRLTGDENAAWDVIQETWLGIGRGIHRLAEAAAFPAWAYQIVSNKCRDPIRREQRRREATETYSQRMQREGQGAAMAEKRHGNLKEALDRLSGPDRAVLSLRYEEGFDTAEIAGILDIPEGTVKSRLFYARQRLREYTIYLRMEQGACKVSRVTPEHKQSELFWMGKGFVTNGKLAPGDSLRLDPQGNKGEYWVRFE